MLSSLFFPNSNFICKIQLLYSNFVSAYGRVSLFWLWLYARNILYNMAFMRVLNFGAMSHFTFMDCVFYNVLRSYSTATKTTTSMYNLLYTLPIFTKWNSGQISIRDLNTECVQINFEFEF